jgi:magnesium chelatase family protein
VGVQYALATCTLVGVEALPVTVEVDIGPGLPGISIVGLPDVAVQEARQRVRSAIRACGFSIPDARIVVNLAPGPLKKSGSGFDLPIAVALLCATRQIPDAWVPDALVVGELALGGGVRPVRGLLACAYAAKRAGRALVSAPAPELCNVREVVCNGVRCLSELKRDPSWHRPRMHANSGSRPDVDFADIAGGDIVKRALQVAAAGGHGLLMLGPPGSGKTMMARRLPTILPPLSEDERCESALIHSVAGLGTDQLFAGVRPFRSPHHSASTVGLIGGGNPVKVGEASLAHNGVLFLDEMSEFSPHALQALRQPLEDGEVVLVRAGYRVRLPASFMLVGASNPCPCGYLGDPDHPCTCSQAQIDRYATRIGGPLMDRIDLRVDVPRSDPSEVLRSGQGTSSEQLRAGVVAARAFRSERERHQRTKGTSTSSHVSALVERCGMASRERALLETVSRRRHLSGRAIVRVLRVARTIADLDQSMQVTQGHLLEALAYRIREGEET